MIKNWYYLVVGILSILFAFTHIWGGQGSFLLLIDTSELDSTTQTTIFYLWHIIAAENLIFGIAFLVMSCYMDRSSVSVAAWTIAAIMIARWTVIFVSTIFKNTAGLPGILIDSIAILIVVGLIVLGTRQKA